MSTFTFQLNSATTSTDELQLETALALETSSPDTMGDNIATAQFTADLNSWFSLVYADGENPVEDATDDVNYMFDATKTNNLFSDTDNFSIANGGNPGGFSDIGANGLVNWHILAATSGNGAAGAVSSYGWADRAPTFGVSGLASTTAVTQDGSAGVLGTDIALHESVMPKRIMAAYGADVTQLLANESNIVSDVQTRLAEGVTAFISAFGATDESKDGVGYKLWTQAVTAAAGESGNSQPLTERLATMISAATTVGDGGAAGGTGYKKLSFDFDAGDVIELELKLLKPSTAVAEPEISVTPTGGSASRDELNLIYKLRIVQS